MSRLRTAYFIVANSAILIVLVVAGTHVAVRLFEAARWSTYQTLIDPVKQNYAHLSPADVDELWRNTDARRARFVPGLERGGLPADR